TETFVEMAPDFEIILDQAISKLPLQQQKVFVFRMQGLKNPEIAKKMNLATDSVKKYYKLSLENVKKNVNGSHSVVIFIAYLLNLE
ncbi:sigma factor-like helix-turn-helix DNA-binding protein, partial [Pedobacter sp.]|uniref:sigma factor-like helix-turn-helix DNA-binding protein n=1 Tax=Pedobacter sp. TaxID=1411316 RepID=UPI003D7F428B